METDEGFIAALKQARKSADEGGIPIGAALVDRDGKILVHPHKGEISALENSGRLLASAYRGGTMYTTLSPCDMCTGACILYKIGRVVIGENKNFLGGEEYLKQRGIEVVVLHNKECEELMAKFIKEHPDLWYEDIGEE